MDSLHLLESLPKGIKNSEALAERNRDSKDPEGSISNKNLKSIKTNFKTTLEYHKTCKTLNPLNTDYYPDPL